MFPHACLHTALRKKWYDIRSDDWEHTTHTHTHTQEWLRQAITAASFSNENIDDAVRDQFLRANVNVEHNKGRFQVLLADMHSLEIEASIG